MNAPITRENQIKRSWFDSLLFGFGAVSMIVAVVWYSRWAPGRPWEMAVAAGAALAFMLVGRVHLFDSIKAGGLELQVHRAEQATQKAEAATEKAYATIEEVRGFAGVVASLASDALMHTGVTARYLTRIKLAHKNRLRDALLSLGITEAKAEAATEPVRWFISHQHGQLIHKAVSTLVATPADRSPDVLRVVGALTNFEKRTVAPSATYRAVLATYKVTSPEIQEALLDYEHFEHEGTFRRPDVWENKS